MGVIHSTKAPKRQTLVVDVFEEPHHLANLRILMLNMDPDERLPDNSEVGCSSPFVLKDETGEPPYLQLSSRL